MQAACLAQQGVLGGGNLVFCAPTSAGKSLVAEIIMLRRLLSEKRACVLVLPFVALCAEKVRPQRCGGCSTKHAYSESMCTVDSAVSFVYNASRMMSTSSCECGMKCYGPSLIYIDSSACIKSSDVTSSIRHCGGRPD